MNDKNKRVISILTIFTIIFTVMGGTLAYWNWSSSEASRTGVAFTIGKDFSCSADGGGHITSASVQLQPTTCNNESAAIKRKIMVTPDITKNGIEISLDLWLNIHTLDAGLSNSVNFNYVLTTSETSCTEGVISKGNFNSKTSGDRVMLLEKNYTADADEPYYLYIWLDKAETSSDTMDQTFDFSLGGNCSNYIGEPEAPVLDPGMIPVTIANDGKVTTVSADNPNWYDYSNKEWANVALVKENATDGVTNSHDRTYYQNNIGKEVTQDDILAYYVWIPRYKYKIPTNKYCYEIENPTMETHPECYGAPYTLTISDLEAQRALASAISYTIFNDKTQCPIDLDVMWTGEYTFKTCSQMTQTDLNRFWSVMRDYHGMTDNENDISNLLNTGSIMVNSVGVNLNIKDVFDGSQYTGTLNANTMISSGPTSIDIIFESKDEDMILGNAVTEYRSHPAFWWDNNSNNVLESGETLAGIWFAKFEAVEQTVSYTEYCEDWDVDGTIDECIQIPNYINGFLPNIGTVLRLASEASPSTEAPKAGITSSDMHEFKSRDWGAVAYLSHSEYGINDEVRINNTFYTGCGASTDDAPAATTPDDFDSCAIKYGSGVSSYPQSTTGNISGIFDMSGLSLEYPSNFYGPEEYYQADKYNDRINMLLIDMWDGQPVKLNDNTFCDGKICYGYAFTETKNWYSDSQKFELNMDTDTRISSGGDYMAGENAGIFSMEFFNQNSERGYNAINSGRRYVIVNEK